jgi:hypothetical protein
VRADELRRRSAVRIVLGLVVGADVRGLVPVPQADALLVEEAIVASGRDRRPVDGVAVVTPSLEGDVRQAAAVRAPLDRASRKLRVEREIVTRHGELAPDLVLQQRVGVRRVLSSGRLGIGAQRQFASVTLGGRLLRPAEDLRQEQAARRGGARLQHLSSVHRDLPVPAQGSLRHRDVLVPGQRGKGCVRESVVLENYGGDTTSRAPERWRPRAGRLLPPAEGPKPEAYASERSANSREIEFMQ